MTLTYVSDSIFLILRPTLFVVTQRGQNIEEFLKCDESSAIANLVVVNCVCKFGDFRSVRPVSVTKLTTLESGGSIFIA